MLLLIMTTYHIPVDVSPVTTREGTFLTTKSGGKILVDSILLGIWQKADGFSDEDIVVNCTSKTILPGQVLVGLACLRAAGLLECQEIQRSGNNRENRQKPLTYPKVCDGLVSAIIVCHDSRFWLEKCLQSLFAQTYSPLEIIVIDNCSSDGSAEWLDEAYPSLKLISLDQLQPLARALNMGIETAHGVYYLLLNPDVELEPDALAGMLDIARGNPSCAAVTPKLRFTWAPAFINGLGNFVGAFSWGTDCGLGHLDLGQFDGWREVPSACFASTLISSDVYRKVGPFDEEFHLYYEDSDWSYRARLLGYTILAAPKAIVYHGYGGRIPDLNKTGLTQTKLQQVSYGRLRFATKILGWKYMIRYLADYFIEDFFRGGLALFQGNWGKIRAILKAWSNYFSSLPNLIRIRQDIQDHRKCSDEQILRLQRKTPMPLIWRGLPCLTWNIIRNHYLPLIISGQALEIPGISRFDFLASSINTIPRPNPSLHNAFYVWHIEGFRASLYWMAKTVQWYLIQP